jgi:tripartite ATP-independent transporter DctM subunit
MGRTRDERWHRRHWTSIAMSPELLTLLMFSGLLIGLFLGHPLAFVLGGVGVLAGWFVVGPHVFGLMINRIYGNAMDSYILVAVPLFILMARFLSDSGITERMFETLRQAMAGLRGGLTLAVILISVLLAATTGIIGASITVIGMIALGPMLRHGYDSRLSAGAIAAGGSLGVLIPPSIMLLIMASYSPLSVGALFAGAMVPGLLLALSYAVFVLVVSYLNPALGPAVPAEERAGITRGRLLLDLLRYVTPPVILIVGVLGSIFTGIATTTEAAAVGTFIAFVLVLVSGRFRLKTLQTSLQETGKITSMVLFMVVGATVFTGVFTAGGGNTVIRDLLIGSGLAPWMIILLMLAIIFVLGMFLDWIGIVLLSFPIFLPILDALGVNLLWFVVLSAVVLQTSFLTPPFGYALFYLKGVAPKSITMQDIYIGSLPFIALIILVSCLVAAFPALVLWLPGVVLG